ncbi:MAG: glycosyltransferase family 2 protein [Actinobacteria bacterium]|nr:glycosyltransferase family 2 protein [Actinomycetota bacterium]
MKIVMTLLVRDEADILDEHLTFHLNAGVDYVIATDHRSVDGTTEILRSYERDGYVRLIREDAERIRQSDWMTHMARLAASEHGAGWVLSSDADEFWWPRGGSLEEVLETVPVRYGVVRALSQSFVPRTSSGWFADQMTVRLALIAPINDPGSSFRPVAKVAHRADREIVVGQGNHDVSGAGMRTLRSWYPIELFHFPLRSPEQIARKHQNTLAAWHENLRGDLARARSFAGQGISRAFYERVALDDDAIENGLAAGLLVQDTRLRDALRTLRGGVSGSQRPPVRRGVAHFDRSSLREDAAYAAEVLSLADADLVRFGRRVDELTARVAALEGNGRRGR